MIKHTYFFKSDSHFIEVLDDFLPVDAALFDDVIQLEEDKAVLEVTVQSVHMWVNSHTVHPVTICCNMAITKLIILTP
jgi:hypothetical protein